MQKTTITITYVDGNKYTARNCVSSSFELLPYDEHAYQKHFSYKHRTESKGIVKFEEFVIGLSNIRSILHERGSYKTLWVNPNVKSSVNITVKSRLQPKAKKVSE